jgi:hypothetical protein
VNPSLPFEPAHRLGEHFDHELAQLELGLRRVIKREFCRDEELAHLGALGWSIARIDGGYQLASNSADVDHDHGVHHTVFFGEPAAVDAACGLESLERTGRGGARQRAMAELGVLLGYPSCCTEAYLTQAEQGESASFSRLFRVGPHRGGHAGNNLFVLSHALISHFPCSLTCEASATLARATWSRLAEQEPERADAVAQLLCAPITVWDRYRFIVDHPTHGPLAPHQIDGHPLLLTHGPLHEFVAALDAPPAGGTRFEFRHM